MTALSKQQKTQQDTQEKNPFAASQKEEGCKKAAPKKMPR